MFIVLEKVPSSVLWHWRGCIWKFWRKTHCCSIQHVVWYHFTEVIQERKLINTRNSNEFLKSYNVDIRMLNLDIGKNKKLVVWQTNLNNVNMLRLRGYWTCRRTMYRWYLMMVCEAVRTLGVLLDGTLITWLMTQREDCGVCLCG